MKKKFIKNSKKIFYTLFVFIYTIMQIISPVMVSANTSIDLDNLPTNPEIGDIYNSTVTAGSLENEGDVLVTKTVTKTNTLGEYTVTFNIKGKKVTTLEENDKPLYAVVVFDRSGSMNCTKYNWMGYCAEVGNKWESAVNGAKTFAKTLLKKIPTANIALVAFSGNDGRDGRNDTAFNDATVLRKFSNTNLDSTDFGSANGGTNLHAGLYEANELLSDTSIPENAVKYVVVISDGQPTFYYDNKGYTQGEGNSTNAETYNATINIANTVKNTTKAEIFSIGYMLPSGTVYGNKTAADILTEVSSPNKEGSTIKHYVDGKPEDVANAFTNIAEEISTANAGTNAQLTDKLGNAFSFVDGNGNTYTSSTIGEITEEGTSFSFNIKIDEDSSNGWHPTNNGFILKYTNYKGEEVTLNSESDPLVYWEAKQYNYVIKYYLDDTNGNPIATENGTAPLNEEIEVNEEKHLSSHIGYEYTGVDKDFNISKNEEENIAIIVYTKVDYNYVINYYKDSISEDNFINRVTGTANYKETIDVEEEKFLSGLTGYEYTDGEKTITISTNNNENIVNIVYTKKNYNYEVRYYLDSLEGTHLGTVARTGVINEQIIVNEELKLSDDKAIGYAYNGINLDFTIEDTNELIIVNVIYNKVKYNWQVNYYKDSIATDTYLGSDNGTAFYNDVINVEEEKFLSDLTGYEYTDGEKTITISTNNNENIINIVYTKKDYEYTVKYYFDGVESIPTLSKGGYSVYGSVLYASAYNLTEKEIEDNNLENYILSPVNPYNPESIVINTENNLINIYYVSKSNITNQKVTKNTNDIITSTSDIVNYNINYTANIKNAIGEVKVIIKDTLPLEIDTTKSNLNGGSYNASNNTITWTKIYNVKEFTTNYDIKLNISYSVAYKNIDADKSYDETVYTNKVNVCTDITYNNNIINGNCVEDSEDIPVEIYGDLVVKYVTYENNKEVILIPTINENNKVGTPYNTEKKDIYGYEFVEVKGNPNGKITEGTTTVIYVYKLSNGNYTEEEIEKTSSETIDSIDSQFNYTIKYNVTINDYIGEATTTIVDTLPYEIDETKSNLNGGVYDKENKTITWIIKSNITENNRTVTFNKEISVVYLNINDATVTNEITGQTVFGNTTTNGNEDETTTIVDTGKVITRYIEKDTNKELQPSIEQNGLVGTSYETKAGDTSTGNLYGYKLVKIEGNETGKIVKGTTYVTYIYEKNSGSYEEEIVNKTGDEFISSINSPFEYEINYNVTINDYIGEATTTIVDTLPYEIDETKSNLNGGVYDKENKTITWIIKSNITENNRTVTFNKEISVVYLNINDATVTNEITGQTVFGNTTTNGNEDETTTIVDTGKVITRYIEKDTNKELQPSIEQNGLVGTSYETKAGDTSTGNLYGYKLVKIEGNETGKIVKGTTYVTYIYEKNSGSYEEEIVNKTGDEFISSINSPFEYEINYNVTINDYIGEATTTIVDTLPYEIDETKSNLNGGVYDKENKTITWIIKSNITENNRTVTFNKEISVVYLNINDATVTNEITGQTVFGNTTTNGNEDETTTIVDTGKVIAHYIEKETNVKIANDTTYNGLVGSTYVTEEKDIEGYFLSTIEGETTGVYDGEKVIEVTYIYEKKGQGGDINPPHTGLDIVLHSSNLFNILGIITLTVMQIIKKKKETNI